MTDDKLYTSLSANTIMAKLSNYFQRTRLITSPTDKHYSLDSEDDFRSGCRNVSHQQQFFSELSSPGRSHYTNLSFACHISQTTFINTSWGGLHPNLLMSRFVFTVVVQRPTHVRYANNWRVTVLVLKVNHFAIRKSSLYFFLRARSMVSYVRRNNGHQRPNDRNMF